MHIHSCVLTGRLLDQGTHHLLTNIRASHHCFTPDFPRVTHGGPEVPTGGRGTPDLEGSSFTLEPWHVFLSSLQKERSLPWNIKPFWEGAFHPGRKQMTPGEI